MDLAVKDYHLGEICLRYLFDREEGHVSMALLPLGMESCYQKRRKELKHRGACCPAWEPGNLCHLSLAHHPQGNGAGCTLKYGISEKMLKYTEQINLSELAETYHFNHSYMTRLFKKMKGQTPIKLINSLRMADAKEMLKKEELSIREISETLGFTDQHYFSRTFKEATGVTPKEYRMLEK